MDVVLVSIGTICRFQKWSLDAIHEGLKALKNTRVIWSLKDHLCEMASSDPRKTKDFWVGSWLPQVEVLAHPAVKLAVIHCGWGSVLEIIDAGVPTLNFPHFGDQLVNSKMLVDRKVSLELYSEKKSPFEKPMDQLTYKDPKFDHTLVTSKVE